MVVTICSSKYGRDKESLFRTNGLRVYSLVVGLRNIWESIMHEVRGWSGESGGQ
jgi:hypothetical protein